MANFLLDTNVVSELIKPIPYRPLLSRFRLHETSCALSAATIEELIYGIERLSNSAWRRQLEDWFESLSSTFELLPYDVECAIWLGRERAKLAARGQTIPALDGQIAAVAVINDLTLVTRNTADFARFFGLRVENWFDG